MENKRSIPIVIYIPAIIIGVALYRQFDVETLGFEKPWLAFVYMLGLGISAYFIVKAHQRKAK
jgi:hypothetical protein